MAIAPSPSSAPSKQAKSPTAAVGDGGRFMYCHDTARVATLRSWMVERLSVPRQGRGGRYSDQQLLEPDEIDRCDCPIAVNVKVERRIATHLAVRASAAQELPPPHCVQRRGRTVLGYIAGQERDVHPIRFIDRAHVAEIDDGCAVVGFHDRLDGCPLSQRDDTVQPNDEDRIGGIVDREDARRRRAAGLRDNEVAGFHGSTANVMDREAELDGDRIDSSIECLSVVTLVPRIDIPRAGHAAHDFQHQRAGVGVARGSRSLRFAMFRFAAVGREIFALVPRQTARFVGERTLDVPAGGVGSLNLTTRVTALQLRQIETFGAVDTARQSDLRALAIVAVGVRSLRPTAFLATLPRGQNVALSKRQAASLPRPAFRIEAGAARTAGLGLDEFALLSRDVDALPVSEAARFSQVGLALALEEIEDLVVVCIGTELDTCFARRTCTDAGRSANGVEIDVTLAGFATITAGDDAVSRRVTAHRRGRAKLAGLRTQRIGTSRSEGRGYRQALRFGHAVAGDVEGAVSVLESGSAADRTWRAVSDAEWRGSGRSLDVTLAVARAITLDDGGLAGHGIESHDRWPTVFVRIRAVERLAFGTAVVRFALDGFTCTLESIAVPFLHALRSGWALAHAFRTDRSDYGMTLVSSPAVALDDDARAVGVAFQRDGRTLFVIVGAIDGHTAETGVIALALLRIALAGYPHESFGSCLDHFATDFARRAGTFAVRQSTGYDHGVALVHAAAVAFDDYTTAIGVAFHHGRRTTFIGFGTVEWLTLEPARVRSALFRLTGTFEHEMSRRCNGANFMADLTRRAGAVAERCRASLEHGVTLLDVATVTFDDNTCAVWVAAYDGRPALLIGGGTVDRRAAVACVIWLTLLRLAFALEQHGAVGRGFTYLATDLTRRALAVAEGKCPGHEHRMAVGVALAIALQHGASAIGITADDRWCAAVVGIGTIEGLTMEPATIRFAVVHWLAEAFE